MEHVQRQSNGSEIMPYLVYVKIHMLMGKKLGCLISRKNYCVSIFHTAQIHKVKSSNFGKTKDTKKKSNAKKEDKAKENHTDQNETQEEQATDPGQEDQAQENQPTDKIQENQPTTVENNQ